MPQVPVPQHSRIPPRSSQRSTRWASNAHPGSMRCARGPRSSRSRDRRTTSASGYAGARLEMVPSQRRKGRRWSRARRAVAGVGARRHGVQARGGVASIEDHQNPSSQAGPERADRPGDADAPVAVSSSTGRLREAMSSADPETKSSWRAMRIEIVRPDQRIMAAPAITQT